MLDKHLLNRSRREIRIDRGAALFVKVRKSRDKSRVRLVLFRYQFRKPSTEGRNLLFEFSDSRVPVFKCNRRRSEEVLECRNQACRVSDVYVKDLLAVLIEDTALRGLKEDIVERIACIPFLMYSSVEVVVHILGFPISEWEPVSVEYHAIKNNTIALWGTHRILRNESSIRLLCARIK